MSAPINGILVPLDGSPPSFQAFYYALDLARNTSAKLNLLNVIESGSLAPEAETALKRCEVICRENNVRFESKILHGDIDKMIVQESGQASLIVMGTHGHTGLKKLFLGSCTEDVLCHAKVPVLTIRGKSGSEGLRGPPLRLANILVPFVDSREGRAAVEAALSYRKMLGGEGKEAARITLLTVMLESSGLLSMALPKSREEDELRAEAAKSGVQVEIARHTQSGEDQDAFAEPVVLPGKSGDLAENILSFLATNPFDLVVMGMQHKDGWDLDAIEAVVRETTVPVLTVTIAPQHESLRSLPLGTTTNVYTMGTTSEDIAPSIDVRVSPTVKRESFDTAGEQIQAEQQQREFERIESETGLKRVVTEAASELAGQPMTGTTLREQGDINIAGVSSSSSSSAPGAGTSDIQRPGELQGGTGIQRTGLESGIERNRSLQGTAGLQQTQGSSGLGLGSERPGSTSSLSSGIEHDTGLQQGRSEIERDRSGLERTTGQRETSEVQGTSGLGGISGIESDYTGMQGTAGSHQALALGRETGVTGTGIEQQGGGGVGAGIQRDSPTGLGNTGLNTSDLSHTRIAGLQEEGGDRPTSGLGGTTIGGQQSERGSSPKISNIQASTGQQQSPKYLSPKLSGQRSPTTYTSPKLAALHQQTTTNIPLEQQQKTTTTSRDEHITDR